MMKFIFKLYWKFLLVLSMPIIFAEFFHKSTGKEYNVGFFDKLSLVLRMIKNNKRIISSSTFLEHIAMATRILNIPKSIKGCVVECGCYKGGSTANLSLVCALCNRQLEIFDSFEGLPQPSDQDRVHTVVDLRELHTYSKHAWYGDLEEVKRNISRYGDLSICNFNVGYFENTLPKFNKQCAFIFLDVDLRSSLETCLIYLWPLLQDGCYLFTHEAPHMEIASLFFDSQWWHNKLNCDHPGLIGAGCGLGLTPGRGGFRSSIGYTVKNYRSLNFKEVQQTGR